MTSLKLIFSVLLIVITMSYMNAQQDNQKRGPDPKVNVHKGSQLKKGMEMRGDMYKHIKDKLKLTDQQLSKIKALRSEHMKKMVDLNGNLKKSMIDLKEIRSKDNFTRQDIIAEVEKVNKAKNDIALATANHRMDVWEILTPEQQKIAKENHQLFGGVRKHGRMHKRF
ncbi:MAG: Spy/CpxP family protein refolding chaperone [Ignavibacteriaceae bacterium]|nr:Spy/CpxP family protein refolding chaperone [Ignavibacteriaceae bacterium]